MEKTYNKLLGIWIENKTQVKKEDQESHYKGIPTNYKELQELAKKLDIPANQSKDNLIQQINDTIN